MIRATRSLSSEAGLAFTTFLTIGFGAGLGAGLGTGARRTGAGRTTLLTGAGAGAGARAGWSRIVRKLASDVRSSL